MIQFCSPRRRAPSGATVINCTSVSRDRWRALSPMLADGDMLELHGHKSWNVENIWQYSKVYAVHVQSGYPDWNRWRQAGYSRKSGVRYPMGRGAVPEYSWLTGSLGKMDVVQARAHIYVPAYTQKINRFHSDALVELAELASSGDIWIWDFDVYEPADRQAGFDGVLQNADLSMGHGFVLAHMICEHSGVDFWRPTGGSAT